MADWKNVQYKDGKLRSNNGGASALSDLTDVDLTNIADGQILKWDATNSKWVNANESGGGSLGHTYSTTEQKTDDVWIDGKPIYELTVSLGALTYDTNWHYIAHGISNIDKVIELYGIAKSNDGMYVTMPNNRPNTTGGICLFANSSSIGYMNYWISGQDWAYAIIRYTKTTD